MYSQDVVSDMSLEEGMTATAVIFREGTSPATLLQRGR